MAKRLHPQRPEMLHSRTNCTSNNLLKHLIFGILHSFFYAWVLLVDCLLQESRKSAGIRAF